MTIPHDVELGITDIVFRIRSNDRHFGTVRISRGAIDFTRAGSRSRKRLTWESFADLMRAEGRTVAQKPIPPRRRTRG